MKTKKILVVEYSQSGQLHELVKTLTAPLQANEQFELQSLVLKPTPAFPFPWPFLQFFNTFPETVYGDTPALEPLALDLPETGFDLVILAYQVWFLSPALPMQAFLKTDIAKQVLHDTPVMTLIACRNMWLMAQEQMKQTLNQLGAHLIDNVVLTDPAHSAFTFISTPLWVLTGKRGPFLNGLIPAAGISASDMAASRRFGEAIARELPTRQAGDLRPMCAGLAAVHINERLIASEKMARRSFMIWGRLLRAAGKAESPLRQGLLMFYILFLLTLILTLVPLSAVIKRLLAPLTRHHIEAQKRYYAAPSGE
jgi:hypothetical protein